MVVPLCLSLDSEGNLNSTLWLFQVKKLRKLSAR